MAGAIRRSAAPRRAGATFATGSSQARRAPAQTATAMRHRAAPCESPTGRCSNRRSFTLASRSISTCAFASSTDVDCGSTVHDATAATTRSFPRPWGSIGVVEDDRIREPSHSRVCGGFIRGSRNIPGTSQVIPAYAGVHRLEHLSAMNRYRIGIDVGGTFTDLVAIDDGGRITTAKSASTPTGSIHRRARRVGAAGRGRSASTGPRFSAPPSASSTARPSQPMRFSNARVRSSACSPPRGTETSWRCARGSRTTATRSASRRPNPLVPRRICACRCASVSGRTAPRRGRSSAPRCVPQSATSPPSRSKRSRCATCTPIGCIGT